MVDTPPPYKDVASKVWGVSKKVGGVRTPRPPSGCALGGKTLLVSKTVTKQYTMSENASTRNDHLRCTVVQCTKANLQWGIHPLFPLSSSPL